VSAEDLEARLWAIESRLAIAQLPSRYAMAADARDVETLVDLFAPDIRDEWRAWVVPVLRSFRRSIHQIVGHRFDLDPDDPNRASGTTYCRAEHEFQDRWIVVLFRYHDEYRCVDGEWTFGALRGKDYWYAVDITERPQSVGFNSWHEIVMSADGDAIDEAKYRPTLPDAFTTWAPFWASDS
jgi:hypothetical protein